MPAIQYTKTRDFSSAEELMKFYGGIKRKLSPPPEPPRMVEVAKPIVRQTPIEKLEAEVEHLKKQVSALLHMVGVHEWREDMKAIAPKYVTVDDVKKVCGIYYSVSEQDMDSPARLARLVHIRQMAQYLCRKRTMSTLPWIGKKFGGRDHTTIIHSCQTIERRLLADEVTATEYAELNKELDAILIRRTEAMIGPAP